MLETAVAPEIAPSSASSLQGYPHTSFIIFDLKQHFTVTAWSRRLMWQKRWKAPHGNEARGLLGRQHNHLAEQVNVTAKRRKEIYCNLKGGFKVTQWHLQGQLKIKTPLVTSPIQNVWAAQPTVLNRFTGGCDLLCRLPTVNKVKTAPLFCKGMSAEVSGRHVTGTAGRNDNMTIAVQLSETGPQIWANINTWAVAGRGVWSLAFSTIDSQINMHSEHLLSCFHVKKRN